MTTSPVPTVPEPQNHPVPGSQPTVPEPQNRLTCGYVSGSQCVPEPSSWTVPGSHTGGTEPRTATTPPLTVDRRALEVAIALQARDAILRYLDRHGRSVRKPLRSSLRSDLRGRFDAVLAELIDAGHVRQIGDEYATGEVDGWTVRPPTSLQVNSGGQVDGPSTPSAESNSNEEPA